MTMSRRDFVRLSLASSSLAWLPLSPTAAFAAVHRPIVLLLGAVSERRNFVAGFGEVLTAHAGWRAGLLASPQSDLGACTRGLRSLRGSRLVYMGDDRDQLLLRLALAGLNARLLCSGHHRDLGSPGEASRHRLQPVAPAWSYGLDFSDDLAAAGQAYVIRDDLVSGELRGSGRGSSEAPWPTVLGRRLATVASGLPLPAEPYPASVIEPRASTVLATLIADL